MCLKPDASGCVVPMFDYGIIFGDMFIPASYGLDVVMLFAYHTAQTSFLDKQMCE